MLYTALGARSLPKERVEAFGGGQKVVIDNFKETQVYGSAVKKQGGLNQDKGQPQCCAGLSVRYTQVRRRRSA